MLVVLLFFADAARAQEFAGDLVGTDASGKTTQAIGKILVAQGNVRIETRELADGYFLIPRRQRAAYFVRPAQRVFMDAKQSSQLTQFFIPVDPDNPCRQWRAAAKTILPALEPLLADPEPRVRLAVVKSWRSLSGQHERVWPILIELLTDADRHVRRGASKELQAIVSSGGASDADIRRLEDDPRAPVRTEAIRLRRLRRRE